MKNKKFQLHDTDKSMEDYVEEIILKISEKLIKLKNNEITTEMILLNLNIDLPVDITLCIKAIMNPAILN